MVCMDCDHFFDLVLEEGYYHLPFGAMYLGMTFLVGVPGEAVVQCPECNYYRAVPRPHLVQQLENSLSYARYDLELEPELLEPLRKLVGERIEFLMEGVRWK